jgi:hypothetical protein
VSTIPGQTALIRKPLGVEPPTLPRSTGVVECDVETPERVDRLVQCSLHILGPGYVATDGESTAAEFLDHPGRVPAPVTNATLPAKMPFSFVAVIPVPLLLVPRRWVEQSRDRGRRSSSPEFHGPQTDPADQRT